jgi:hypothetical protein
MLRIDFRDRDFRIVGRLGPILKKGFEAVLGRARKNRVRTSASLLPSESMTRPSQARARAQFTIK